MTMNLKGMLDLNKLRQEIESEDIETVIVAFTDHYGRLVGKRFDADFFLESCVPHGTHSCNYLLTTDMEMEPVPGYQFANWELGYGDFHLIPDQATLRQASWLERTALILCDLEDEKSHLPISIAPRSILRRQIEACKNIGYRCLAASELEYYLFDDLNHNTPSL